MLFNLLNTLLGLWLVAMAVLDRAFFAASSWHAEGAVIAAAIVLLAGLARRSDYDAWHANVTTTLGGLLVASVILSALVPLPLLASTWVAFWVGLLTAFLSLWALLYRPGQTPPSQTRA